MKENDSHSVQSSPRAEIITNVDKGLSQLVITGVSSEDYGKYQCVANNSAGVKESQVAFLYPGVEGKILLTKLILHGAIMMHKACNRWKVQGLFFVFKSSAQTPSTLFSDVVLIKAG